MRNLETGSISPQFHVVFDELFTTVHSVDEHDETWIELFVSERDYYGPDEDEVEPDDAAFPDIDPEWLPIAELPPTIAGPQDPVDRALEEIIAIVDDQPIQPAIPADDQAEQIAIELHNPDEQLEPPPRNEQLPVPNEQQRPQRERRPNTKSPCLR